VLLPGLRSDRPFPVCTVIITVLLSVTLFAKPTQAQRTFGIDWEVPKEPEEARAQLQKFQSLGITCIQIHNPVTPATVNALASDSFKVFLSVPNPFLLSTDPVATDTVFKQRIEVLLDNFRGYPQLRGMGLFQFGNLNSTLLYQRLQPYKAAIEQQTGYTTYFLSARSDLPSTRLTDLFDLAFYQYQAQQHPRWSDYDGYFLDTEHVVDPLRSLGYLLDQTAPFPERPVFLPGEWVIEHIKKQPELAEYLRSASRDSIALYPFGQAHEENSVFNNWLVLLLLFIWTTYALHYSISPIYRRNLSRYFFAHNFFIRDIMEWRIRLPYTAFILFCQHILICGMWFYALAHHFYTPLGVEALQHHYPLLENITIWPFSFFVLGLVFAFTLQSLGVIWLYIFTRRVKHIFQSVTIYSWPLQLNLISATLITPLIISGSSFSVLLLLTSVFVVIWVGSYIISAKDIASFITQNKHLYLLATIGLLILLIATGYYFIFIHSNLPELFELLVSFN